MLVEHLETVNNTPNSVQYDVKTFNKNVSSKVVRVNGKIKLTKTTLVRHISDKIESSITAVYDTTDGLRVDGSDCVFIFQDLRTGYNYCIPTRKTNDDPILNKDLEMAGNLLTHKAFPKINAFCARRIMYMGKDGCYFDSFETIMDFRYYYHNMIDSNISNVSNGYKITSFKGCQYMTMNERASYYDANGERILRYKGNGVPDKFTRSLIYDFYRDLFGVSDWNDFTMEQEIEIRSLLFENDDLVSFPFLQSILVGKAYDFEIFYESVITGYSYEKVYPEDSPFVIVTTVIEAPDYEAQLIHSKKKRKSNAVLKKNKVGKLAEEINFGTTNKSKEVKDINLQATLIKFFVQLIFNLIFNKNFDYSIVFSEPVFVDLFNKHYDNGVAKFIKGASNKKIYLINNDSLRDVIMRLVRIKFYKLLNPRDESKYTKSRKQKELYNQSFKPGFDITKYTDKNNRKGQILVNRFFDNIYKESFRNVAKGTEEDNYLSYNFGNNEVPGGTVQIEIEPHNLIKL